MLFVLLSMLLLFSSTICGGGQEGHSTITCKGVPHDLTPGSCLQPVGDGSGAQNRNGMQQILHCTEQQQRHLVRMHAAWCVLAHAECVVSRVSSMVTFTPSHLNTGAETAVPLACCSPERHVCVCVRQTLPKRTPVHARPSYPG